MIRWIGWSVILAAVLLAAYVGRILVWSNLTPEGAVWIIFLAGVVAGVFLLVFVDSLTGLGELIFRPREDQALEVHDVPYLLRTDADGRTSLHGPFCCAKCLNDGLAARKAQDVAQGVVAMYERKCVEEWRA